MLLTLLCLLSADPVFPDDLVRFAPGEPAAFSTDGLLWASAVRERGAIVEGPGGVWRLYFTGYDGTREGIKRVGLAESADGGRTWSARPDPVTPEGLWTEDPFVLHDGERYQMLAEGRGDEPHRLSSDDGIEWTPHGSLTIRRKDGTPIGRPIGTPVVARHAGVWHLLYERRDAGIWLATSDDLQDWTNVADEPVFTPSEDGFDSLMIAFNQVVRRGGRYYAYYHGTNGPAKPRPWAVGVAVSDDLRTWRRFGGNPITDPADNRSSPWVVGVDDRPRLFTTHGSVQVHGPPTNP